MTDERAKSRLDQRLTVATGYVATGLLALTLLVGAGQPPAASAKSHLKLPAP
jgi:hypothetical protein